MLNILSQILFSSSLIAVGIIKRRSKKSVEARIDLYTSMLSLRLHEWTYLHLNSVQ